MNQFQADTLTAIAREMHENAVAHGWHDERSETRTTDVEEVAKFCANIHAEVSELWEAARGGQLFCECDKGIPLTCMEEELADIVIRVMDFAAKKRISLGDAIKVKHEYNQKRSNRHGGKLA